VDFVQKVNTYIGEIPGTELNLIAYNHKREDEYLLEAAEALGDQCVCMDQDTVLYGGGYSRVEFCDLFVNRRQLVHVKRYGASSTLSHLFAQGVTAATLFVSDPEFRRLVDEKLPEKLKIENPVQRIVPGDYEIVYAVISSQKGGELTLPFFSRISLQNATQILKGYGFNVSVLKIMSEG
jgi:uncharacterized protein (TIGR04141 family)